MMLAMHPMPPMSMLDAMMQDAMRGPCFASRNDAPRLSSKDDKSYTITVDVPGVRTQDLSISVEDNKLQITGETLRTTHTHVVNWTTALPEDADAQDSTVEHVDGVLTITVPRKAASEPTRIEVGNEVTSTEEDIMDEPGSDQSNDEKKKKYTLTISAPGISASELEVVAEADMLKVSGESKRTGARIGKRFRLPRDADVAAATASHIDGLLSVVVPKKPRAQAKTLLINEAPGDFQVV